MHMIAKKSNLAGLNLDDGVNATIKRLQKILPELETKEKSSLIQAGLKLERYKEKKQKTVEIKKLIKPVCFRRLDANDDYKDFDYTTTLEPIKVVTIADSDLLMVVSGSRRLGHFHSLGDVDSVDVEVIGEARCLSQAAVARAAEMTKVTRPLSNFELALGLWDLRKQVIEEFGKDQCYLHGGKRTGDGKKKVKVNQYIASLLGMKRWVVQALITFGRQLGPLALKALHNREDRKDLSLREIQKLNGGLKEAGVHEKIKDEARTLRRSDASPEEQMNKVGELAWTLIAEQATKNKARPEDTPDDDDENDSASDQGENAPTEDDDSEGDNSEDGDASKATDAEDPLVLRDRAIKLLNEHKRRCRLVLTVLKRTKKPEDFSSVRLEKLRKRARRAGESWQELDEALEGILNL